MSDNARTLPCGGVIDDHRTPEQVTQTWGFVVATDSFMSGWGQAPGKSYFAVPVRNAEQAEIVEANMEHRSEMKRVRFVLADYRPRLRAGDHLSIRALDDSARFYQPGGFAS